MSPARLHEPFRSRRDRKVLIQFADWLGALELQQKRLKDNPKDHRLRTYYHRRRGEVDFINLDNASNVSPATASRM